VLVVLLYVVLLEVWCESSVGVGKVIVDFDLPGRFSDVPGVEPAMEWPGGLVEERPLVYFCCAGWLPCWDTFLVELYEVWFLLSWWMGSPGW
jgi:hypothetical protein